MSYSYAAVFVRYDPERRGRLFDRWLTPHVEPGKDFAMATVSEFSEEQPDLAVESQEFGEAIGFKIATSVNAFVYDHWRNGQLVRGLTYYIDTGWTRVVGEAEAWEAEAIFTPAELERLLEDASSEAKAAELRALWAAGRLEAGRTIPFADPEDVFRALWEQFNLPGVSIGVSDLGWRRFPCTGREDIAVSGLWAEGAGGRAQAPLALSPNGFLAASWSADEAVRLWLVASGSFMKDLADAEAQPLCLAFSPKGDLLAAGMYSSEKCTLAVWLTTSGKRRVLWGNTKHHETSAVAFSPDGSRLASGGGGDDSGVLRLWDAASGDRVWSVAENWEGSAVHGLAFSPDGRFLLVGRWGGPGDVEAQLELRSSEDGRMLWSLPGPYRSVAVTPDGRFAAACDGEEGPLSLVDLATGKHIGSFPARSAIGLTEEGKIVPGTLRLTPSLELRFFDAETGQPLPPGSARLCFSGALPSAQLSQDGRLGFTHSASGCSLVELAGRELMRIAAADPAAAVACSSDGRIVILGRESGALECIDTADLLVRWKAQGPARPLRLRLSPDAKQVYVYYGHAHWRLWDGESGKELPRRAEEEQAAVLSDGRTAVLADAPGKAIVLRDLTTGEERRLSGPSVHETERQGLKAARSANGDRLLSLDRDLAIVWNARTGEQLGHARLGACAALAPDASFAVSGRGTRLSLLDGGTLKELGAVELEDGGPLACVSIGDDGAFAVGTSKGILLWGRARLPAESKEPEKPPRPAPALAQAAPDPATAVLEGERAAWELMVETDPSDPEAWLRKAGCEFRLNLLNQANSSLNALVALGMTREQRAAAVELSQVLYAAHRSLNPSFYRAVEIIGEGRWEESLPLLDASLAKVPDWAAAWANKGKALIELERYGEALPALDRSYALDPYLKGTMFNKGMALLGLGRFAEAEACFALALHLNAKDARAWYHRGVCLGKLGRLAEGLGCLDEALKLAPGHPEILEQRGLLAKGL